MLISVDQALDELKCHRNTIYNYIYSGKLPAWKKDGQWWVALESVEVLKKNGKTTPSRLEQLTVAVQGVEKLIESYNTPAVITLCAQHHNHHCRAYSLLAVNEAMRELFGYGTDHYKNVTCCHETMMHEDDVERLVFSPPGVTELRIKLSNGLYRWVRVKCAVFTSGLREMAAVEFESI